MNGSREGVVAFSRLWGEHEPATVDLLACAAVLDPSATALAGTPAITFGQLHEQVTATAEVLAAQGLDSDAAVGAVLTVALMRDGVGSSEVAERVPVAVARVREAAREALGPADLASPAGVVRTVAARNADRVAVVDVSGSPMTYRELDTRSDAVAAGLLRHGAGAGTLVGVGVARGADLIVVLLGVLKAGAGYVPLDSAHPVERIRMVVRDAAPALVVTDPSVAIAWSEVLDLRCVSVADVAASGSDRFGEVVLPARIDPGLPAYVMYTSGSTGVPKGVVVTHGDVLAFLKAMVGEYDVTAHDVWAGFTSFGFDVSVAEMWLSLVCGGRFVAVGFLTSRSPGDFLDLVSREGVSVLNVTPSAFYEMAGSVRDGGFPACVRLVMLAGEALDFLQVRRWFTDWEAEGVEGPRLNNMYGPTEATVYATRRALTRDFVAATAASDVGSALPGMRLYVLDSRLGVVPDGVPGDVYLAGSQVADGYAHQQGLTASRFVADPFGEPGDRMYLTGDVGLLRDGSLEFLGRSDDQVKLRGYRIELGEVESALSVAPGVVAAAAAVHVAEGSPDRLVGYVTGDELTGDSVREFTRTLVPDYMVPDVVMTLARLPLTVNGKLDRRALPAPVFGSATEYVAPQGTVEESVARICAQVLGVERLSVTESVFDVGGNSMLAARIVARVCDEFGIDLNLRDLFEDPTVHGLAVRVARANAGLPPVVAVSPRPGRVPLSFAQARMWFINRLDPDSPAYNIPLVLSVTGPLDTGVLRQAVIDVVVRHEVLRTIFVADASGAGDSTPYQVIADPDSVAAQLDWEEVTDPSEIGAAVDRGFDVSAAWPIRIRVHRGGPSEFLLAIVVHHIAADGQSLAPLISDLLRAYEFRMGGRAPDLDPLPIQIADYAIWQHTVLGGADDEESVIGRQLGYWRERLAGVPDVLELPADRPRPEVASGRGDRIGFEVPVPVARRIEALARTGGVTPFMVVHAALAVLLARLTATADIAVATPVAGRGQAALDDVVGMFANTLVLRTAVVPELTMNDLLNQVRCTDLDAFAHAEVPFENVVADLVPHAGQAYEPLAQVMLSFNPVGELGDVDLHVLGLEFRELAPGTTVDGAGTQTGGIVGQVAAQRDLTVTVVPGPGSWHGSISYATDLFDRATMAAFAERFVRVLDALTADPSMAVGDADIFTEADRAMLAQVPAPVTSTAHTGSSLAEVFTDSAAAHPDSLAVTAGAVSLTYAGLDARSRAIAAGLRGRGVRSGDLVGVATARSVDLVASIIGVLRAGAAYVPLDLTNPVGRLTHIVSDSGVTVVLTDASSTGHPLWESVAEAVTVVDVDHLADTTDALCPIVVQPDSRAYVIYTSGSTGLPKGVEVTHRDVLTLLDASSADFDCGPGDVWTMFHSYAFDFSVWELWGALFHGGRSVIIDRDLARDPDAFVELLLTESVTVLNQTPSAFYQLIDARRRDEPDRVWPVRYIVFGGEALSFEQVRRWFDLFPEDRARLVNMYGITETTVHVSFRELDRAVISADDGSLIGRPLSSLGIHILDGRLRPVPAGVAGEMYVAGGQLAQSYLARPDLTSTRFVANPFGPAGSRLYRTGDVARRVAAGPGGGDDIEYLGRADAQVQLRGFRIEFGEVEAGLLAADGVVGAAARIVDMPVIGEQLIGYVVAADGAHPDARAVREQAATLVPGYMVPSTVLVVESLPLTANGKLDRDALPIPEFGTAADGFTAPQSAQEILVAEAFAEVLGVPRVGVTDSFFDIGGNSLSATRLASRVAAALGVGVAIRDVFAAPSVRELIEQVADNELAPEPVTALAVRPDPIPVSFAQQRMWFINRFDPAAPTYNVPVILRITGPLDVPSVRAAIIDIIERHEVLRTTFPAIDGVPCQRICPAGEFEARDVWRVVDSRQAVLDTVATGFDVAHQWPIRACIWRKDTDVHVLAVIIHHIAGDGESLHPLVTDLVSAYTARAQGRAPEFEPLPVQFADFAIWQHDVLGPVTDEHSVIGRQLSYWRRQLDGLPDVLELPTTRPRPPVASMSGGRVEFVIPAGIGDRITAVARGHGVTPFMVVHAAFAVLMARLSATTDIAVSTPIAGRGQRSLDPLVGMFVNTLVLRTEIRPATRFAELLEQVRHADLEAFAHADAPFETVVEALNPVRSEAFSPLAQVMLSFDPAAALADADISVAGLTVEPVRPPDIPAQLDLITIVASAAAGSPWSCAVGYATDLFDAAAVTDIAARFVRVLDAVTADPEAAVGDADILIDADRVQLAAQDRPSAAQIPDGRSLVDVFARTVADFGARPAVSDETGTVLTYAQLDECSAAVAAALVTSGVRQGDLVGIATARSVDLAVAILGVLKAGAGYVPLDVTNPVDRLAYLVTDSEVSVVLTDSAAAGHPLWDAVNDRVRCLDIADLGRPAPGGITLAITVHPDSLAYVIYTSGSTGRPKGVEVTHRDVVSLLGAVAEDFDCGQNDVWTLCHSYAFDFSVWELWGALATGGTCLIVDRDTVRDPALLIELIAARGVTVLSQTPSAFYQFIDARSRRRPNTGRGAGGDIGLRYVVFGGEALSPQRVRRWWELFPDDPARLINMYGITETTVHVTFRELTPESMPDGDRSLVGRPLSSLRVHILDSRLRPVPIGVPGEIYVSGEQLARGYAGRAVISAERFVADPFAGDGRRMYRTGDIARRVRADGTGSIDIEYLGRNDFQVMLRGFRIELGEIEAAMASADGVAHAAVGLAADAIVGYVVPATGADVDSDAVIVATARRVPAYMVPAAIVVLDDLPLTANGKLDRRALPVPDLGARHGAYTAPQSPAESLVAQVFAELLGVGRVSVTDSFFDLGGNSLSAMRLSARAGDALGVTVSVRDVFAAPSVRELVAAVSGNASALPPVVPAHPRPARIPLSDAQSRMWFVNQFDPGSSAYNIPLGLRMRGPVDLEAIRAAFVDVLGRHEALRTRYPVDGTGPYQDIIDAESAAQQLDWRIVGQRDQLRAAAVAGFRVESELPVRVRFFRDAQSHESEILVVVHHIACDGESVRVLLEDLVTAYAARGAGGAPEWESLPVQYADFTLWQREIVEERTEHPAPGGQLGYWVRHLAGMPQVTDLPMDRPRPAVAGTEAGVVRMTVRPDIAGAVAACAAEHRVTPFMVFHTALALTIARMTGKWDVVIGTPIAGRADRVLDRVVGMFVNTLVLRTTFDPSDTVTEVLAVARRTDLDAFAHAEVQFDQLVDTLIEERPTSYSPLFQIALTYTAGDLDVFAAAQAVGDLAVEPVVEDVIEAKTDLMLSVHEGRGHTEAEFTYATALFDEDRIVRFGRVWERILESLVGSTPVADPAVGDIDILGASGTGAGVVAATGNAGGSPSRAEAADDPSTLVGVLAARDLDPTHPAVLGDGALLAYAEFESRTNRVARALIGRGIGPGDMVAVGLGRTVDAVVAAWGVLKSGAVYVGAAGDEDPAAWPGLRLWIGPDGPDAVERAHLADLEGAQSAAPVSAAERTAPVRPGDVVALVRSRPGAPLTAMTHAGLSLMPAENLKVTGSLATDPDTRVPAFGVPGTIDAFREMLAAVGAGHTLVVVPDGRGPIGERLAATIAAHAVTDLWTPLADLKALEATALESVRNLTFTGEPETAAVCGPWKARGRRLFTLFGPAELSGTATTARVRPGKDTGVGRAVGGVVVRILDGRLAAVADGTTGDLYLGGAGIALGYLGDAASTAAVFVADPAGEWGDRIVATGLRAYLDDAGDLHIKDKPERLNG
ncbi:amino acid adenylation domain-containing protein [Gordonia amarae]|uniref:non-ribosomal peptide synthetase n=1 Tax=Gordonia amarae TaxID=36821 RepID=UPI001AF4403E|nr:non-ribosomal peptide synthetase [Gordonia amarae]QHN32050.1 amino acid adenylation domain-containing protein [Gordonia amarae]